NPVMRENTDHATSSRLIGQSSCPSLHSIHATGCNTRGPMQGGQMRAAGLERLACKGVSISQVAYHWVIAHLKQHRPPGLSACTNLALSPPYAPRRSHALRPDQV